MTKSFFRGLTWRAIIAAILSISFLLTCLAYSRKKGRKEQQEQYRAEYGPLLMATEYHELDTDVLDHHPDVKKVFAAYDDSDRLVGYIVDVQMETETVGLIHTQMSISDNGENILSIRVMDQDDGSALFTEQEIEELLVQLDGSRIPIGMKKETLLDVSSKVEYDPLLGLHDGIFYARAEEAGSDGYIDYCEMEVRGGRIVKVTWDAENEQTHMTRSQDSISGEYKVSGNIWAEQSYRLSNYLVVVQDPVKLGMKSDSKTEIIDGVTISISTFVTLVNECIDYSRNSITKEMYLQNQDGETEPEETSSEVTPTPEPDMTASNETQIEETIDTTPKQSEIEVIGGEDGVVSGDTTNVLSDSVDGIPMSEIRSYINGIPDKQNESAALLSTVNQAYKFMREYLNWVG